MTLVLALGNRDQVIQISDRRLTDHRGGPCVLPENKATILTLADARLVCGFAGLARTRGFRTGQWIVEALAEAAKADHLAHGTVERFTTAATARFREPDVLSVERRHRGLSILFTGFRDVLEQPHLIAALVTNFQDFSSGVDEPTWDEFQANFWSVKDPNEQPTPTYVQRIGRWPAMVPSDEQRLRRALEARRSPKALVDMGVGVVREVAARSLAAETIGKDISSAVVGAARPPVMEDGSLPIVGGFHPEGASHRWHGVNQVVSVSDDLGLAVMDPVLKIENPGRTNAVAVQKVGRNKPCPCGSGKKYKRCHGG